MTDLNTTINEREFLLLHGKLYAFLREAWNIRKVGRLKDILRGYLDQSIGSKDDHAFQNLILEMKTAVLIIDEIGLKQATVCALLLYHPVLNRCVSIDEVRKLFGDEVKTIIQGLVKINEQINQMIDYSEEGGYFPKNFAAFFTLGYRFWYP